MKEINGVNADELIRALREHAEGRRPYELVEDLCKAADLLEMLTDRTGIEDLGLSVHAYNALMRCGYRTANELRGLTEEDLLRIAGIGKKTAKEIMEAVWGVRT